MNPNTQSDILAAIELRLDEISSESCDSYEHLWQDEGGEG